LLIMGMTNELTRTFFKHT